MVLALTTPVVVRRNRRRLLLVLPLAVTSTVVLWSVFEFRRATRQRDAITAIRRIGGWSFYNCEFDDTGTLTKSGPSGPLWMQRILGRDFFGRVDAVTLAPNDKLDGLPKLSEMSAQPVELTDTRLRPLCQLRDIKWLALNHTCATDDFLEIGLRSWPKLERLWLTDTRITDAALQHIASSTRLERLWLDDTQVTDSGMHYIRNLSGLKYLSLQGTQVTDEGLKHLLNLNELVALRVIRTNCTFSGLLHLLTTLQHRSLDEALHVAGYVKWSDQRGIVSLDLNGTRLSVDGIAKVERLQQLEWLFLNDTQISDAALERLGSLQGLTLLDLRNTAVTDAGLIYLRRLPKLRTVHLEGTQVTREGVAAFQRSVHRQLRVYQ